MDDVQKLPFDDLHTRDEHVAWCKMRALQELQWDGYSPEEQPRNGLGSIFSDLRKHSATANHAAIELGGRLMFGGHLKTREQVREWIEGIR